MQAERKSEELNRSTAFDNKLRPTDFEGFVGQAKVRDRMLLAVRAAKERGEPLDHVLFSGPPGLGKTTLSYILGEAMGVNVKTTSGPVITKPGDLAGLLTSLEPGDIVFIDEIHRMAKTVEEYLYSAMEDYAIDIMLDQGPNARSVRLELPRFTLVGATTRIGLIAAPLRARFGFVNRLDYYEPSDLAEIVESPTGPPPNLTQIVSSMRRSISSSPCGSISRSDSDSRATSSVMKLPALT